MIAIVVKLKNEELNYELRPEIKLGTKYNVMPERLGYLNMVEMETGWTRKVLCVWAEDMEGRDAGYLPADFFEWPGKDKAIRAMGRVH